MGSFRRNPGARKRFSSPSPASARAEKKQALRRHGFGRNGMERQRKSSPERKPRRALAWGWIAVVAALAIAAGAHDIVTRESFTDVVEGSEDSEQVDCQANITETIPCVRE